MQQNRSFGFILACGLTLIGLLPLLREHGQPRWILLGLAGVFAVLGVVLPGCLTPVRRAWMKLGVCLGWMNTRILLSIVFFVVFSPIRLIMALMGKDAMRRKMEPDADSYRIRRSSRESAHMERQF